MPARRKTPNQQTIILFFIGIGLVLIALAAILALPKAQEQVESAGFSIIPATVNFPAPDVQLTDLHGNPVALSDFRGHVVLYNAWATWCPPCKEEMPTLQAYFDAYKDDKFVIIAIEDGQPLNEVRAFVEEHGLTFPVWPDPEYKATTAFRANSLPTSFVIDREGTVRLTWTGAVTRAMLEKYVTPLLKQ